MKIKVYFGIQFIIYLSSSSYSNSLNSDSSSKSFAVLWGSHRSSVLGFSKWKYTSIREGEENAFLWGPYLPLSMGDRRDNWAMSYRWQMFSLWKAFVILGNYSKIGLLKSSQLKYYIIMYSWNCEKSRARWGIST